ncbi:MAG: hypothetical protein ACK5N0_13195 [Synechococcaceae cyanobacterium]
MKLCPKPRRFFQFPLGFGPFLECAVPSSTSLLALVGIAGFALLSLLFGIFT